MRATCARVLQGELYWWGEGMNAADKPAEDVAQELEVPERLPEEIDPDILRKYFTLTASDLEQVEQCRGPINRLGFAVQLCTLRWRGHFLGDTRQVPESVLATIASQLGVLPMPIEGYPQNEKTRFEHSERIRQHLKFARCGALQRQELLDHLITVAQALPRATALRHRCAQRQCRYCRTRLHSELRRALPQR